MTRLLTLLVPLAGVAVLAAERSDPKEPISLGSARLRHFPVATACIFLPGDQTIVSGGDDGLRLWDAKTGKLKRHLKTPRRIVSFHCDQAGKVLAALSKSGIIQFFDTKTWEEGAMIKLPKTTNPMIALSPDGKVVLAATERAVQMFDSEGKELKNYAGRLPVMTCMAVSPDGKMLALGTQEALGIWDIEKDQLRDQLLKKPEPVRSLAFNVDGSMLAAGTESGAIRLWDMKRDTEARSLDGGPKPVRSLEFSSDGRRLAGLSEAGVRVWELFSLNLRANLKIAIPQGVERFSFTRDGSCVAVGTENGVIAVHDWLIGGDRFATTGHRGPVQCLSVKGDKIRSWADDNTIREWTDRGKQLKKTKAPDVKQLVCAGNMAMGVDDKGAGLWNMETGKEIRRFEGAGGDIKSLALSFHGKFAATGDAEGKIQLWNADTGKRLHELESHRDAVTALAFAPDGEHLLSGSADGRLCLWKIDKGTLVRIFRRKDVGISCLAFRPDGKQVAAGGIDSIVRFHDPETGNQVNNCRQQHFGVSVLAYSPDGKTLASGSKLDSTINTWDTESGKRVSKLDHHRAGVTCLQFLGNDRLISGSADTTLLIWQTR